MTLEYCDLVDELESKEKELQKEKQKNKQLQEIQNNKQAFKCKEQDLMQRAVIRKDKIVKLNKEIANFQRKIQVQLSALKNQRSDQKKSS